MSSEPDASVLRRSIDQPDCFALLRFDHCRDVGYVARTTPR